MMNTPFHKDLVELGHFCKHLVLICGILRNNMDQPGQEH